MVYKHCKWQNLENMVEWETVHESGVVNRYTWKYNELHDPC